MKNIFQFCFFISCIVTIQAKSNTKFSIHTPQLNFDEIVTKQLINEQI